MFFQFDDREGTEGVKSGTLPDGVFGADTKLIFCCRDDGFREEPIRLPNTQPLTLFHGTNNAKNCGNVKGICLFFLLDVTPLIYLPKSRLIRVGLN